MNFMKSYIDYAAQLPKNVKIPDNLKLPDMPKFNFQMPQVAGLRTPPPPNEKDGLVASDDLVQGNEASASSSDPTFLEPRPIDDSKPRSNLDLINECDNFPYLYKEPEMYLRRMAHYYHLQIAEYPGLCLGYVLPSVAAVFRGLEAWTVDDDERTLTLIHGTTEPERTAIVANTTAAMRSLDYFRILRGWRDESYAVYGPKGTTLFTIERSAASLLGIAQYGAHLTAYVREPHPSDPTVPPTYKIWVPRRSDTKETYPGMMDNSVAGGLPAGESPLTCIIRECEEEASLPADLVRPRIRPAGTVSYFQIRGPRAGGETGLLEPEVEYVFDLDLSGADVTPKPSDGEAQDFRLMSVEEVRAAMAEGKFKPNCALVLLDFFVRHGLLTTEDEPDYVEIVSRLHRVTEFPTR